MFVCLNYYFGNGMPAIGLLIFPSSLKTVYLNGGQAATMPAKKVVPKDFTHDTLFTGNGTFTGFNTDYSDELHLNGNISSTGGSSL